jgi:hypothetical protein
MGFCRFFHSCRDVDRTTRRPRSPAWCRPAR